MEQRCHLSMIWLTWLGLPALAIVVAWRHGLTPALIALAVGIAVQVLYVRSFPLLSTWIGYGSVADRPAIQPRIDGRPPHVTFYTARACPFCPIVRRRLVQLQELLGFEFEEQDVTFRPDVIRAKGLRSVPVVEANGRQFVGNATSAELVAFLMPRRPSEAHDRGARELHGLTPAL